MKNKIFNFAVIGCGRMGQRRMQTILNQSDAKLLYAIDKNKTYKELVEKKFKCNFVADYKAVVSRKDIDCVIVSVPNKWHKDIVRYALLQGKHVWCEKPLARNPIEAKSLVEVAKKSTATLKVGANLRYFPNVQKAKELLTESKIGEVYYLRSWIGHAGWTQDGWFADKDMAGGGAFLDNGSHIFDLVRWFLGEVKSCFGIVRKYTGKKNVEDNGFGIFETNENRTAFVQSSWTEWNGYMYMELYGSNGYIYIDNRGKACKTILGTKERKEVIYDYSHLTQNSYKEEFVDYMKALQSGKDPVPSGFDGCRAVEMAWGVYKSSEEGKKVRI